LAQNRGRRPSTAFAFDFGTVATELGYCIFPHNQTDQSAMPNDADLSSGDFVPAFPPAPGQLDAWCADELEKAAAFLEDAGQRAMAASVRGIGILHRVKALETDLRQLGRPAEPASAVPLSPPGDTVPIRLASPGDDGKDETGQSP
jgi:hypothetical protein